LEKYPVKNFALMMSSLDPVVVCSSDNRYAIPLAVMLRSLAEHLAIGRMATVWVLDGGISRRNKRKIIKSLPLRNIEIHWAEVDTTLLADMPVSGHVSLATYYRMLLGSTLPKSIEKVIYLDVDIIVLSDISELWRVPMNGYVVCAVPEPHRQACDMLDPGIMKGVGLAPSSAYFNAGVMMIDLVKWRRANLLERACGFVRLYGNLLRSWDQDILNCLLIKEWGALEEKWNRHVDQLSKMDERDWDDCRRVGGCIHFASGIKPWTWWASHPAKGVYFGWVDRTAWKGWRPRPPLRNTIGNRHWYGKWIRTIPGIGPVWRLTIDWVKRKYDF